MSAIAETPFDAAAGDRLAKRNALVLATGQALAGANNTVIVATGSILGVDDGAGQEPRHAAGQRHGAAASGPAPCRSAFSPSATAAAPRTRAARPAARSPA